MMTIVEASLPPAQFALQSALRRVPGAAFEAVRTVADGGDVLPLLWATGADAAALTDALEADDSTDRVRALTRRGEAVLYRMSWADRVRTVTTLLVADHGVLIGAQTRDDRWTFRVLFPERDAVAAVVESCDRFDLSLRVERIHPLDDSLRPNRSTLTSAQLQTVEAAFESGYYAVPRETTLTELAADLDVSHQALSERLRRGHRQVVETTFGDRLARETQH